jgi:hypothetical protein
MALKLLRFYLQCRLMELPMKLRWFIQIVLLIVFAIGSPEARAQLLFSGGEDIDFNCKAGNCYITTTSGCFRPAWAREALDLQANTSDPPANRYATPTFSANSTLWIHAQYDNNSFNSCNSNNNTNANSQMIRVFDNAGNPALVLVGTGTSGQLAIASRTTAGVFSTLVTCPSALNSALTQLDMYINYGTSGEVALYNNSVRVCDFTGNVTNGDGATTLNQLEFASAGGGDGAWSEVIAATTDTRAMARFTANTAGNGYATGFTGTNICSSIWNAISVNDNNYGYTGSPNVIHECTINNSFPGGDFVVLGLVMSGRVLVGGAGPQHFDFVTRVGGTDYTSPDFAPNPSFSNIQNYIQTVNPATSNPWLVTDFTASGFNVGEESKP